MMKIHKAFIPSLMIAEPDYRRRLITEMNAVLYG